MKSLKINFAPRRRMPTWLLYVIAAAIGGAGAWNAAPLVGLSDQLRQRQLFVAQAQRELEAATKCRIVFYLAGPVELTKMLKKVYR